MAKLQLLITSACHVECLAGHWFYISKGDVLKRGKFSDATELKRMLKQHENAPIELYLPGEQCTTHWIDLPKKSRDAIKSIPYQIEPLVLDALEDLHLVPLLNRAKGSDVCPVWVCRKSWMQRWLDKLQALEIRADVIRPDYSLLWGDKPSSEIHSENRYLQLDERVIFTGLNSGAAASSQFLHILDNAGQSESLSLDDLAPQSKMTANLLTGPYKNTMRKDRSGAFPKLAAVVFAFALFVNLLFSLVEYTRLASADSALSAEAQSVFEKALPGSRLVDPAFQIQQALEMRQQANEPSLFLESLSVISAQLGTENNRVVNRISYSAETRELHIYYSGAPLAQNIEHQYYQIKPGSDKGEQYVSIIW